MGEFYSTDDSKNRKLRIVLLFFGVVAVIGIAAFFLFGREAFFWWLLQRDYEHQRAFFYETLALGESRSEALGWTFAALRAVAWMAFFIPFFLPKKLRLGGFGAVALWIIVIYIMPPIITDLFSGEVCFNQSTGKSVKWYVKNPDGHITLYDSPGYDTFGVEKKPVTTDICRAFQLQEGNRVPHLVLGDHRGMTFFNQNGDPIVWYSRGDKGEYRLFDAPGHDPYTSDELRPVTPRVRDRIISRDDRAEESWNAAIQKDDIETFQHYIDDYPDGKHIEEAKSKIAVLKAAAATAAPQPTPPAEPGPAQSVTPPPGAPAAVTPAQQAPSQTQDTPGTGTNTKTVNLTVGHPYRCDAQDTSGEVRWPCYWRLTNFDPSTHRITGEIRWTTLNGRTGFDGKLNGNELEFTEVRAFQLGSVELNCSYNLMVKQGVAGGAYICPSGHRGSVKINFVQ